MFITVHLENPLSAAASFRARGTYDVYGATYAMLQLSGQQWMGGSVGTLLWCLRISL